MEKPFLSAQAKADEQQVQQVLESHNALMAQRGEIFGSRPREERDSEVDEVEGAPAAPVPSSSRPMQTNTTARAMGGGTFCNSTLGLIEIGLQKAAKLATCKACSLKIQRGTSRCAYALSKSKFHCYIHPECFASYLQSQKGSISQARAFLHEQQRKLGDSQHPPQVVDTIKQLERDLRQLAGE